jgi:hypothetical protein
VGSGFFAMTKGIALSRRCEASSMSGKFTAASVPGGHAVRSTKNPYFIGFFRMARRLLIDRRRNERPRYAAFVGALSCCLPLALRRPRWTASNRRPRRNRRLRNQPASLRTRRIRSISPELPQNRPRPRRRLSGPAEVRGYRHERASCGAKRSSTGSTTSASRRSPTP